MADDPTASGGPLSASIGDQLHEKAHLDAEHEAEKREGRARHQRIERRKAVERDTAARHAAAGVPETARARLAAPLAEAWGARPWAVALAAAAVGFLVERLLRRR